MNIISEVSLDTYMKKRRNIKKCPSCGKAGFLTRR
jgi:ribosomal protein S27AE